jgi:hypothetical protein
MLTCTPAADGATGTSSPDRIGLSRSAFEFEAAAGGLAIKRLAASQALYQLNEQMQFVAAMTDPTCVLPPGHHIVAGHYVLRFDA